MNSKKSGGNAAQEVRNVVVVGPGGSGKTTVLETLLNAVGATTRVGRVEDGTTVMDFEDVEKRLKYSVNLAVASVEITDPAIVGDKGAVRLNLLDSPGNPDFVGELRSGLRGSDAALFVVSATDGIDGATRRVWNECGDVAQPRAIVVTDVDEQNANFENTVQELKEAFGSGVHALYVPYKAKDPETATLISVVRGQIQHGFGPDSTYEDVPAELADSIEEMRGNLIEDVITEAGNEELMERYLEGEDLNFDAISDDLTVATANAQFFPVMPVVATTGLGVKHLLRVLCNSFPTPADHGLLKAYTPAGGEREMITHDPNGPLIGQIIKTTTDPFVGRISVVRLFSGTLRADQVVHVSGHASTFAGRSADDSWHRDHDEDEKIGALARPMGGSQIPVEEAYAGEIVTVARLSKAETGDTISSPEDPAVVMTWEMPEPLYPTALRAQKQADEGKLMIGLQRLQAEDPSVRVEVDPTTGQLVMWTMGEQHLTVMRERLRDRINVEIDTFPVLVPLRETLAGKSEVTGKHVKQSGGHGQYAVAELRFEPLPMGQGFEFVDEVVGGAVPKNYIPSVEKGIVAQMAKGISGYPMVDIRATLYHGKAHSVDSSDAAFQMAGSLGLQEAAKRSGITILEPVDSIEVLCDDEYVGAVMSDLSTRRGRVKGTEAAKAGQTRITADVPAFELIRYSTALRSLARGTGSFKREYISHEPAPSHLADRLTEGA
ncbi:MAG TPA: elongation factor G-like protein EF-G2 [Actinomycetaceae bacterium]|nr:elongation factor G-like protein EF-G2 [Actinomycetaceae bacterium]